jgi:uncharacterized lipoprotein YajG
MNNNPMMTTKEKPIMNRNLKTAATLAAMGAAALLSGCAIIPSTDTVHYVAPKQASKMPGAHDVTIRVVVKNEKKRKPVSTDMDMIGLHMAGQYVHVRKDFQSVMDSALENRGLIITEKGRTSDVLVKITVHHFYVQEEMGVFEGTDAGTLVMTTRVFNKGGHQLYMKTVAEKIKESSVIDPDALYVNDVLDKMVNVAIQKVINDQKFQAALVGTYGKGRYGVVLPNNL